jgi:hypothetical protein
LKRYIVLAAVAVSLVLVSTASASATRFLTIGTNAYMKIPSLDLQCEVFASDPDHHEAGPVLYCNRSSTKNSRPIEVSLYHIKIGDEGGNFFTNTYDRAP